MDVGELARQLPKIAPAAPLSASWRRRYRRLGRHRSAGGDRRADVRGTWLRRRLLRRLRPARAVGAWTVRRYRARRLDRPRSPQVALPSRRLRLPALPQAAAVTAQPSPLGADYTHHDRPTAARRSPSGTGPERRAASARALKGVDDVRPSAAGARRETIEPRLQRATAELVAARSDDFEMLAPVELSDLLLPPPPGPGGRPPTPAPHPTSASSTPGTNASCTRSSTVRAPTSRRHRRRPNFATARLRPQLPHGAGEHGDPARRPAPPEAAEASCRQGLVSPG